ncbi:MAG: hypothetical protein ACRDA4_04730 [Filifactoraceae bacterium]
MPTIDLGICIPTSHSLSSIKEIENTILVSLEALFQQTDVAFVSAYLYDEKTDSGVDLFALNNSLQQIINSEPYNKITFTVNGKNCFVTIGFIEKDITIGINVDYDFFSDISQRSTSSSLINFLQENFYELHQKIRYQFAFADFDAEFEYSYSQLIEMIRDESNPYCLLIIDDHGLLKHYRSSYNLLGCNYLENKLDFS